MWRETASGAGPIELGAAVSVGGPKLWSVLAPYLLSDAETFSARCEGSGS
jgi:hypothetical protein